jgi:hypothetical protein
MTMTEQDQAPDYSADRVARVPRHNGTPTPETVAAYLPSNYRIGKVDSWQIIVRGKDNAGWTLEDYVIPRLGSGLIHAEEVQREVNAIYQFRTGKDGGSGSFLCPPGHPALAYSIYGFHSSGKGKPNTSRQSGPDTIMSIESLAEDEGGYYPAGVVARARRILAEAQENPSELWIRNVYGYFKNSYSPDGTDRNVSNALSASKLHCACGEEFWNVRGLDYHIDHSGGTSGSHHQVPGPEYPDEHHLGYLCVKSYFPDHQVRTDLIESGGNYGAGPCVKCGDNVQYEARHDAYCVVKTSPWSYNPDCPQGGRHTIEGMNPDGTWPPLAPCGHPVDSVCECGSFEPGTGGTDATYEQVTGITEKITRIAGN